MLFVHRRQSNKDYPEKENYEAQHLLSAEK